jgi:hypothetical protein
VGNADSRSDGESRVEAMIEDSDWSIKHYAWVGPQQMTANGLELHAVVAVDQRGGFHAGTRYGPKGGALPELGPEEFWSMETYKAKDEAIFAAKTDANQTLQSCNQQARTQALLDKATASSRQAKKQLGRHLRLIDR